MSPFTLSHPSVCPTHLLFPRQVELEIKREEALVRQICTASTSLLRQRNEFEANTRKLPVEMLSLIFRDATFPHDESSSIPQHRVTFKIAHVCSLWRRVAWSTPEMWTSLKQERIRQRHAGFCLQMLHLYLRNIKNLQLSLSLGFRDTGRILPSTIEAFDEVLLDQTNAGKICSLSLGSLSVYQIPSSFTFPRLQRLFVNLWNEQPQFEQSKLPRLTSLTINSLSKNISIPSSQLTTLELKNVHPNLCANFLRRCPNLRRFENKYRGLRTLEQTVPEAVPWYTEEFTLQYLEDFTWTVTSHHISHVVLSRIRLPAAKVVQWVHDSRNVTVEDLTLTAVAFFENLPKNVNTLMFERLTMTFPKNLLARIFSNLPQVQEIILNGCTLGSACAIFSHLSTYDSQSLYLPSLKTLTIVKGFYPNEKFQGNIVQSLSQAGVESTIFEILHPRRFPERNSHFCLNLVDITEITFGVLQREEFKSACSRLQENGFQLEVLSNGNRIDVGW